MASNPDYYERQRKLENDITAAKSLLTDLQKHFNKTKDSFEREKLEINIENVTRQLKDWQYELHLLTAGAE